MRNKLSKFRDAGCWPMLRLRSRTIALLLLTVLLLAESQASSPQGTLEVLGDMAQLEASMHSAVLSDLQETQAAVSAAAQPSGLPDSSAVVGRMFQMQIPTKAKDSGSIVKVSQRNPSLPFISHSTFYISEAFVFFVQPVNLVSERSDIASSVASRNFFHASLLNSDP